jgi:hypothetical protein
MVTIITSVGQLGHLSIFAIFRTLYFPDEIKFAPEKEALKLYLKTV